VPGVYLLAIVLSFAGTASLDRRFGLGVLSWRYAAVAAVVVPVFLAFDALATWRGWFFSNEDWVLVVIPPGIPPEEPLLLAFLVFFSLFLYEGLLRWSTRT
jgi:hypothetical protein